MDVGMLWYDSNEIDKLETKIRRASSYYKKKYGQDPNLCFVHPSMLRKDGSTPKDEKVAEPKTAGIELRCSKSMLPNHFWLGFNQEISNV
ncbi:MAG: hypothetical protein IMY76_08150 [Chloroflexi bacterium]|nr:hypothetical protein [Chloroflexota bacterium]